MFKLIANTEYLVEGIRMTFTGTVKNGEVVVFDMDGISIKFTIDEVFELDIEKIK